MRASDLEFTFPIEGVSKCFFVLKLVKVLVFSQNIASVKKNIYFAERG